MGPLKRTHSTITISIIYIFIMEMLLAPVAMAQSCDYEEGSPMETKSADCPKTAGMIWDCEAHKCVFDQTTTALQDSHEECEGIEDDEKRKECVDSVAMGAAQEDGMASENFAKDAAEQAELLGWANLIFGALNAGAASSCMSTTIMTWTGRAQFAAELYSYFFLADKAAKLQEKYEKKTVAEDNYDAQVDAFKFLKDEQDTIADVAKQKEIIYTVAAAGYTAAAGTALFELAYRGWTGTAYCTYVSDRGLLACAQAVAAQGEGVKKADEAVGNQEDIVENRQDSLDDAQSTLDDKNKILQTKQGNADDANAALETAQTNAQTDPNVNAGAKAKALESAQATADTANSALESAQTNHDAAAAIRDTAAGELKIQQDTLDGLKIDLNTEVGEALLEDSEKKKLDSAKSHSERTEQNAKELNEGLTENQKAWKEGGEANEEAIAGASKLLKSPEELAAAQDTLAAPDKLAKVDDGFLDAPSPAELQAAQDTIDTHNLGLKEISDIKAVQAANSATAISDAAKISLKTAETNFAGSVTEAGATIGNRLGNKLTGKTGSNWSWPAAATRELFTIGQLANIGRDAVQYTNMEEAKDNFDKLPEKTRKTTVFNLKKTVLEAQTLEVKTVNMSSNDPNYITNVKSLIEKWSEIATKAAEMGDKEAADRAKNKIDLWQRKLPPSTTSFDQGDTFKVFNIKEPVFKKLNSAITSNLIKETTSDLNAYIAFKEWYDYNRGKRSSFQLSNYKKAKSHAPDNISTRFFSFKSSLVQMIKLGSIIEDSYAVDSTGKKIGSLAGNMGIGMLKTWGLKLLLCSPLMASASLTMSAWLQHPAAVAVMASASAAVNFKLAKVAGKEKKQSENNAKTIKTVLDKFEIAQATFCPNGREDKTDLQCFCYTEDNQQAPSRINSKICQDHWAKNDDDFFAGAGDYDGSGPSGCSFLNGKYDPTCKCKKLTDTNSGKNACLESPITSRSLSGLNFGSAGINMRKIGDHIASLGNGGASTGTINAAQVANAALTQKKINDKMVEKLNARFKSKGMSPIRLNSKAAMNKLVNTMLPKGKMRSKLLGLKNLQTRKALSPKAQKALATAMKKTGIQYSSSSRSRVAAVDNYSFLTDGGTSGGNGKVDNSYMKKKYKYNNEINNNKGANLFEIISKRYTVSGMKKLFGDK